MTMGCQLLIPVYVTALPLLSLTLLCFRYSIPLLFRAFLFRVSRMILFPSIQCCFPVTSKAQGRGGAGGYLVVLVGGC